MGFIPPVTPQPRLLRCPHLRPAPQLLRWGGRCVTGGLRPRCLAVVPASAHASLWPARRDKERPLQDQWDILVPRPGALMRQSLRLARWGQGLVPPPRCGRKCWNSCPSWASGKVRPTHVSLLGTLKIVTRAVLRGPRAGRKIPVRDCPRPPAPTSLFSLLPGQPSRWLPPGSPRVPVPRAAFPARHSECLGGLSPHQPPRHPGPQPSDHSHPGSRGPSMSRVLQGLPGDIPGDASRTACTVRPLFAAPCVFFFSLSRAWKATCYHAVPRCPSLSPLGTNCHSHLFAMQIYWCHLAANLSVTSGGS